MAEIFHVDARGKGVVVWAINLEDKSRYDSLFFSLKPASGYLTGQQARDFFIISKLPGQVLGHIWELSDFNKDGRMDKHEFSIAMFLIEKKLGGHQLPSTLPPSLKRPPNPATHVPAGVALVNTGSIDGVHPLQGSSQGPMGAMSTPPSGLGMGVSQIPANLVPIGVATTMYSPQTQPHQSQGGMTGSPVSTLQRKISMTASVAATQDSMSVTTSQEWAIPQASKLKYTQLFNTYDRNRTGYLIGMQARNILLTSNLSHIQLAQIWNLSDIDNDGQLSCEEFVLAMHLIDMVRVGDPIPQMLPIELIPPSYRKPRSGSLVPVPSSTHTPLETRQLSIVNMGSSFEEWDQMDINKIRSFEDKKRENFERGQMELQKRRQALLDIQQKEKDDRQHKEMIEEEKRERERQELEQKRQQMIEQQLERQREIEMEQQEQRRKQLEQKEAARRELERQRQAELERQHREQLEQQRLRDQEEVLNLKARNKKMISDIDVLTERNNRLNDLLRDTRSTVNERQVQMHQHETTKLTKQTQLDSVKQRIDEFNTRLSELNSLRDGLEMQLKHGNMNNPAMESYHHLKDLYSMRQITVERLKTSLADLNVEIKSKRYQLDQLTQHHGKVTDNNNTDITTTISQKYSLLNLSSKIPDETTTITTTTTDILTTSDLTSSITDPQSNTSSADPWAVFSEIKQLDETRSQQPTEPDPSDLFHFDVFGQQSFNETSPNTVVEETPIDNTTKNDDVIMYRAIYPFEPENSDELGLQVGDVVMVSVHQATEPGWLGGECNGMTGWFPDNYVEKVSDSISKPVPLMNDECQTDSTLPRVSVTSDTVSDSDPFASESATNIFKDSDFQTVDKSFQSSFTPIVHSSPSPVPGQGTSCEGVQAQALYAWRAKKENHLNFNKGDLINVIEQQDMWWCGEFDNKVGWFPKSYVKPISGPNKSIPSFRNINKVGECIALFNYHSSELGDLSFNQGDTISLTVMVGEWWTGTLGGVSGIFPANYVELQQQQQQSPTNTTPTELSPVIKTPQTLFSPALKTKYEVASVLAPYTATGTGQLSLTPGQIIIVRRRNPSGWWEGEIKGAKKRQVGWFPANYVKVLTDASIDLDKSRTPTPTPSAINRPTVQPLFQAVAQFEYTALHDDELTFTLNSVINIIAVEDDNWYKGEMNGVTGILPSAYVIPLADVNNVIPTSPSTQWCTDTQLLQQLTVIERKRQGHIYELINTEETYLSDLQLVVEVFYRPLVDRGILSLTDAAAVFVNWKELISCNTKLYKAFKVRQKSSEISGGLINTVGDILCENIPHMNPYARFCSCHMEAMKFLLNRENTDGRFRDFCKECSTDQRVRGMPLNSYLVKPMQRMTKYPLLIQKIVEHTGIDHPDYSSLKLAKDKADELCNNVNEGIRETENTAKLEWLQSRVQCEGLPEELIFNSVTNMMGPRKLLHHKILHKVKSGRDLMAFLFNDFLLLTQPVKPINVMAKIFSLESRPVVQYKMYRMPLFLNEIDVKSGDGSDHDHQFTICHQDEINYLFKVETDTEKHLWVDKIEQASKHYHEMENKKALDAKYQHSRGIGRLLVVIQEGCDLKSPLTSGRCNPFCLVSMASQEQKTKVLETDTNPKWNNSMQFIIKDINQDVLCITVFHQERFSPDEFMGRAEIKVSDIAELDNTHGPAVNTLKLQETQSGEVIVKLHLQLFKYF